MQKAIVVEREEAIKRLKKLRSILSGDFLKNTRDTELADSLTYISTITALLETSSAKKVRVHFLIDQRKKKNKNIVHISLPTHHQIWDKFAEL